MTDVDEYADLKEAPSTARGTRVAAVMKREPLMVELGTPVEELASPMSEAGVHELPVLENGVPVGVVSALEILELVAEGGSGASHEARRPAVAVHPDHAVHGPARKP